MCTFSSILPRQTKANEKAKKRKMIVTLKPCPDEADGSKTWYRFRLLNFTSKDSTREHPFIVRYVHQHWAKTDKGYDELENEVTCPMTDWMPWDGDRFDCPICKYANSQWAVLKESNYKNVDARKKNREFGRIFQAIIPVYVVNDPNFEGNNGKFRAIIFQDKDKYKEFYKRLETQLLKGNCFNGVAASDICIHVSMVEHVNNEGAPNEYRWKTREIDKIAFSKPYDLPAITREAVDSFPFDSTFYVPSIKEDIDIYMKKYIKVQNDDIIEEEDDVLAETKPKKVQPKVEPVVKKELENDLTSDPEDIDDIEIGLDDDVVVTTSYNTDKEKTTTTKSESTNDIIDDLVDEVDSPKSEPVVESNEPKEEDLDKILDGLFE